MQFFFEVPIGGLLGVMYALVAPRFRPHLRPRACSISLQGTMVHLGALAVAGFLEKAPLWLLQSSLALPDAGFQHRHREISPAPAGQSAAYLALHGHHRSPPFHRGSRAASLGNEPRPSTWVSWTSRSRRY